MISSKASSNANVLNRELLRWIQSLDLAYSIKNVKRDFSNGFLIAEILSRYFDKEISMHSYDNGIGSKVKKDNWDQLHKMFKKIPGLDDLTTKEEMDAIIHCENGAVVNFLKKLYRVLTSRQIQEVQQNKDEEIIPPYAKPTGSALIRDKMRDPEIAELTDELTIENKIREIHSIHEEQLQKERTTDPDRFSSGHGSSSTKVLRGSTRTVEHETPIPAKVMVKEVQVKTINDRNLAHLRAAKDGITGVIGQSSGYNESSSQSSIAGGEVVGKRQVTDVLNAYILRKVQGNPVLKTIEASKDPIYRFFDIVKETKDIPGVDLGSIIRGMEDEANTLTNIFLLNPKEFWKISSVLFDIVQENLEDSAPFSSSIYLLCTLGNKCTQKDAVAAAAIMADFGMEKLCSILLGSPEKRQHLLKVVYSFCSSDVSAHIQTIKKLREHMNDIPTFIHCLSILVFMEEEVDEGLLDLYLYYCSIGLDNPSPKLCAACIAMFTPLTYFDPSIIIEELPRLQKFSSPNAWWEIKAQLIIVSSTVLREISDSEATRSTISIAMDLIRKELDRKSPLNVRRIALSHLSGNLRQYPELVPLFVDVLMSIPTDVKELILSENSHGLPLAGVSGTRYILEAITENWDSYAVARQLYHDNFSNNSNGMNYDQLIVLLACAKHIALTDTDRLYDLYADFRDWIIQAASSDQCCGLVTEILALFILRSEVGVEILQLPTFLSAMAKSVMDKSETRQERFAHLLRDIRNQGGQYEIAVRTAIEAVEYEARSCFGNSILGDFNRELGRK